MVEHGKSEQRIRGMAGARNEKSLTKVRDFRAVAINPGTIPASSFGRRPGQDRLGRLVPKDEPVKKRNKNLRKQ